MNNFCYERNKYLHYEQLRRHVQIIYDKYIYGTYIYGTYIYSISDWNIVSKSLALDWPKVYKESKRNKRTLTL